jgi:hypothetical protein
MAIGGIGTFAAIVAWRDLVTCQFPAGDIEEVHAEAPALLRRLRDALHAKMQFAIVHVGWSNWSSKPVGWAYNSAADFEPVELRGHAAHPMPIPDSEGYSELFEQWIAPPSIDKAEAFHVALATVQMSNDKAGLLPVKGGFGGQLHLALTDRHGVRVTAAVRAFGGYARQLAEARERRAELVDGFLAALGTR